jgi:hypothetical protein
MRPATASASGHPAVSATEFISEATTQSGREPFPGPVSGAHPEFGQPKTAGRRWARSTACRCGPAGRGPAPALVTCQAKALGLTAGFAPVPDAATRSHQLNVESRVDPGLDREHRTGGIEQDALGVRPQDELANRSASAQADHDEVCVDLVGHLDQIL